MIPLCRPVITEADRAAVNETIDRGFVSGVGPAISEFEHRLSDTLNAPNVIACSSGTAALHLSLLEIGIGEGDEVVTSDLTFAATANAAMYCGAEVTMVDSSLSDWNLDGQLLLDHIRLRADSGEKLPSAVVVVDIIGAPVDREPFIEIRDTYRIPIVEDAAEALGSSWADGGKAGTFGQNSILSFNGNKIVTSGNGGAVVTKSSDAADRIRHLANQAKLPGVGYMHDQIGYNYRLSSLNAALGASQLARLPDLVAHKQGVFGRYVKSFEQYGFESRAFADRTSSQWLSSFLIPETLEISADEFVSLLSVRGVEARPIWTPLHQMSPYAGCRFIGGTVSETIRRRGVSLPCSEDLTEQDQEVVIGAVLDLVKQANG